MVFSMDGWMLLLTVRNLTRTMFTNPNVGCPAVLLLSSYSHCLLKPRNFQDLRLPTTDRAIKS